MRRLNPKRWVLLAVLAALVLGLASWPGVHAAQAQAAGGLKMTAQAGYGGFCRSGSWLPLRVTLENSGADLDGRLEVQQNPALSTHRIFAQDVSLPNQSRKTVIIPVYPEGYLDGLNLRLVAAGKAAAELNVKLDCLSTNDRLFAVLSETSTPFNILGNLNPPNGRSYLAQIHLADLPDNPAILESVDTLIISNADTGSLSRGQQDALSGWVSRGGRLVVTGGPGWQPTAAGLSGLLPLQVKGTRSLDDLSDLARFSQRAEKLTGPADIAVGSPIPGAQILAGQPDVPLAAARPVHLGEVVYLTFDPSLEPFAGWQGREDFYRALLERPLIRPGWAGGLQNWDSAMNAVSSLPNLQLPRPLEVIGFLLAYVAVIGPVNFMVLRRIKRRELAWATVPILVVTFSLLAFGIGAFGRGKQAQLTRLAVVQSAQAGASRARVDGLVGIFSPNRTSYSLQVGTNYLAHPIPENNSRGGFQTSRNWTLVQLPGGGTKAEDIRVDVGGVEAVAIQGQIPAPDIRANLTLTLNGSDAVLSGEISNHSGLTLERAVLLAPGGVEELGTLQPNSQTPVQAHLQADTQAAFAGNSTAPNAGGKTIYAAPSYYPGYFPGADSWMNSLAGGPDYYSNTTSYQRYSLLSAMTDNSGFTGSGAGGQVYLGGWSKAPLVDAELVDQKFAATDLTLYLIRLDSNLSLAGSQATLYPGMFSWSVLDSTQSDPGPYNIGLGQGSFSLAFRPIRKIAFQSVEELTLHLANHGDPGTIPFKVLLWDFQKQAWEEQKTNRWGDYPVANPENFVTAEGEVRLRLVNDSPTQPASLERADFSLVVKP